MKIFYQKTLREILFGLKKSLFRALILILCLCIIYLLLPQIYSAVGKSARFILVQTLPEHSAIEEVEISVKGQDLADLRNQSGEMGPIDVSMLWVDGQGNKIREPAEFWLKSQHLLSNSFSFNLYASNPQRISSRQWIFKEINLSENPFSIYEIYLTQFLNLSAPKKQLFRVRINGKNFGLFSRMDDWEVQRKDYAILPQGTWVARLLSEHETLRNGCDLSSHCMWKKWFINKNESKEKNADYSQLYSFLDFVENTQEEDFQRGIFSFLDFENAIQISVYDTLLGIGPNGVSAQKMLVYNENLAKFKIVPIFFDLSESRYNFFEQLRSRLMRHPEFKERFVREVSRFLEQQNIEEVIDSLYLNADVLGAVRFDQSLDLKFHDVKGVGQLWSEILYGDWKKRTEEFRDRIKRYYTHLNFNLSENNITSQILISDKKPHEVELKFMYSGLGHVDISNVSFWLKKDAKLRTGSIPANLEWIYHFKGPREKEYSMSFNESQNIDIQNGFLNLELPEMHILNGVDPLLFAGDFSKKDFGPRGALKVKVKFGSRKIYEIVDFFKTEVTIADEVVGGSPQVEVRVYDAGREKSRERVYQEISSLLQKNEWLKYNKDTNEVIVDKEMVRIRKTVVIPRDTFFVVPQGTRFRFSENASLISFSPITVRGTEANPVYFSSDSPGVKWGVIGVVSVKGKSNVMHARISDAGHEEFLGVPLEGAISFIDAPYFSKDVEINNSEKNEIVQVWTQSKDS